MQVLKFGGTSMGDEHTWRKVLQIIREYDRPAIIVSATARTTRHLIAAAEQAATDYSKAIALAGDIEERHKRLITNFMGHYKKEATSKVARECEAWIDQCIQKLKQYLQQISEQKTLTLLLKDAVASIGEQLSSRLFVYCASIFGLPCSWIDARDVIKTDSDFGSAKPDFRLIREHAKIISKDIESGKIPVIGGYYGEDADGNITTLGFEGSDLSASLIGAALDADAIEIWTDVSGIYTCDPRVVTTAESIRELSFREATELAYFGAKVLHPATMNPAEQKQIPILVKNIFEPEHPGTKIQGESPSNRYAKAMTYMEDVSIIIVTSPHTQMGYEFLSKVFEVLETHHIPVNVVTTTEASVSVALRGEYITSYLLDMLEKIGKTEIKKEQGIISLIGCNFNGSELLSELASNTLPDRKISMISYSRAKKNLNMVFPQQALVPAVKAIHRKLFET